jgi:hypothetical protein
MTPILCKAQRVVGHNLVFRNAVRHDAEFILNLRTDEGKARHLSTTPPSLAAQIDWLSRCANDPTQAYFVIESRLGEALGTVRLYDPQENSFCWGSWIICDGAPASHAVESALMVYRYAQALGFSAAHFDVRKLNRSVWKFHERFGAVRISQSEDDFYYTVELGAINASLLRYSKYLPNGIDIEWGPWMRAEE